MRVFPSTVLLSLLLASCVLAPGADAPVAVAATPAGPIDIAAPTDPPPSPPAHLVCTLDAECTRVFRRCGSCDCGAPLAKAHVGTDTAERDERCRDVLAPQCEMDCRRTTPRCEAGRCALAADVPSSPR